MSGLSPAGRDAALRRVRVFNRVLAGTAIAFTGVLADVAAQAFPGHARRHSAATRTGQLQARRDRAAARRAHARHSAPAKLEAPAQAPATSTQAAPATTTQAAPATTTQAAPTPAPSPQPAAPAPVVSGGS